MNDSISHISTETEPANAEHLSQNDCHPTRAIEEIEKHPTAPDCGELSTIPVGSKVVLPDGKTMLVTTPMQIVCQGLQPPAIRDPRYLRILVAAPEMRQGHAYLDARVDTGSATNLITENLIATLSSNGIQLTRHEIGDDFWGAYMSRKTVRRHKLGVKEQHQLLCADGGFVNITHYVRLSFETSFKEFSDEIFEIWPHEYSGDGDSRFNQQTDILLGAPWLTENSVLMMDPAYQGFEDDKTYDVLEPRIPLEEEDICMPMSIKHIAGHSSSMATNKPAFYGTRR